MPNLISNRWTIKKLVQNTYMYMENRFDYKLRDYVGVVRIERVKEYDVRSNTTRVFYQLLSKSWPQYKPFLQAIDKRGRDTKKQFSYKHLYSNILQLDRLSINVPFKGREGSLKKPVFGMSPKMTWKKKKVQAKNDKGILLKDSKGKIIYKEIKIPDKIINDVNAEKGVDLDFVYMSMWVWQSEGILYGPNYAKWFPNKTNPQGIVFAGKHFLATIEYLMTRGILKND